MILRRLTLVCLALMIGNALAQVKPSDQISPDSFLIAEHFFIDIGPPNDYYTIYSVRSTNDGSAIERISVTPHGDACSQPATVRIATAKIPESIRDLLGPKDPCSIPEKELRKEIKRCKHCLVFSGSKITMQIACGRRTRMIRSDILDRDMFHPAPHTPEHTSWMMHLLTRLNQATGPGPLDKPILFLPKEDASSPPASSSGDLIKLKEGGFDSLFPSPLDKLSELFLEAQRPLPIPTVTVLSSTPFSPISSELPKYPPIARAADFSSSVTAKLEIGPDGTVSKVSFVESEHNMMLRPAVASAASRWKFPEEAAGQHVDAIIDFKTNCTR
jgi:TonB family protein